MTLTRKYGPESKLSVPGREVLWLAASAPPAQLVTFLRSRGLSLVARSELQSTSPVKLLLIEASSSPAARAPSLSQRRLAVMHPDPGNADALAQALRAKGAEVVALSLNPDSLQRVETLDPDAVIMEAGDFSGSCWEIVRALWQHPRLRFATIVLATPELMGNQQVSALDIHDLSFAVTELAADYVRLCKDAQRLDRFSFELETLGPSRSLRALLESGRSLRVLVSSADDSIEIDLAEHIIVGAQSPAGAPPTEGLLGVHALNLLLSRVAGRVEVRTVDHPVHTNVMAPLDSALHMTRDSISSVRPSALQPQPFKPTSTSTMSLAAKPKAPRLHDRTLIGVPAVKLPASALPPVPRTSPGLPPPTLVSGAPAAPVFARAPEGALRPSIRPHAEPRASTPAPSDGPPADLASPVVRRSFAPPPKDDVTWKVVDTHAVRSARAALPLPASRTRWVALAVSLLLALLWWGARGLTSHAAPAASPPPPAPSPLAVRPGVVVAPPPRAVAPPLAMPAAQVAAASEPVPEAAQLGQQNRANARRAARLSDQGNTFRRRRMWPSARARYLEALRVYPDYPRALAGLTQLALSAGAPDQALAYAQHLVEARPGQAAYQLLLGDAQRAAGAEEAARASYQAAARLGSRSADERLAK